MSTVREIETAIGQLSPVDLAQLQAWLKSFDSDRKALPPADVRPAELTTPEERIAAFQQWVDSHHDITAIADDSRESIYEGRGE